MRIIIQRVSHASVEIDNKVYSKINNGLLLLLGITNDDNQDDIEYIINKTINLRIFNDDEGKMNLSIKDKGYDILLISQFTLYANTRKGNRPSYINAAKPDIAIPLYESFITSIESIMGKSICTGVFGADMKVSLLNDGPVTIAIDSKNK